MQIARFAVLVLALSATLVGGILAVAQPLSWAVSVLPWPTDSRALAASMIAALAVAGAASPVMRWVQSVIDGLLFRDRRATWRFVTRAERELAAAQPRQRIADLLTWQAADLLDLQGSWLVLADGTKLAAGRRVDASRIVTHDSLLKGLPNAHRGVPLSLRSGGGLKTLLGRAGNCEHSGWSALGARLLLPLTGWTATHDASAKDALLGVWALGPRRSGASFDSAEQRALRKVARRAALLLDFERLHRDQVRGELVQRDRERALAIQASLVPSVLPTWTGQLEFAALLRPGPEAGGGFYDVFAPGPESATSVPDWLGLTIVDVNGKGLPAAVVAMQVHSALRAIVAQRARAPRPDVASVSAWEAANSLRGDYSTHSPAAILRHASAALVLQGDEGFAVDCAVAWLWSSTRGVSLSIATAGQSAALRCRDGRVESLVPPGECAPLGAKPLSDYQDAEVELRPGDAVVLGSASLVETPRLASGEPLGLKRLGMLTLEACRQRSSAAICDDLFRAIQTWGGEHFLHKDVSLVVLRVPDSETEDGGSAGAC